MAFGINGNGDVLHHASANFALADLADALRLGSRFPKELGGGGDFIPERADLLITRGGDGDGVLRGDVKLTIVIGIKAMYGETAIGIIDEVFIRLTSALGEDTLTFFVVAVGGSDDLPVPRRAGSCFFDQPTESVGLGTAPTRPIFSAVVDGLSDGAIRIDGVGVILCCDGSASDALGAAIAITCRDAGTAAREGLRDSTSALCIAVGGGEAILIRGGDDATSEIHRAGGNPLQRARRQCHYSERQGRTADAPLQDHP